MNPITTSKQRVFGLDVVRALAIILILCSHSTILLFPESETTLIKTIQFFGTIGVDIFFVLSGFLIGTILLKYIENNQTKPKHFIQFWMRRWFRTLPNYYLVLLINIGLVLLFKSELPNQFYKYFFFIQNFSTKQPDFFTESWSLSIEEFAYIIGPFLLLFFGMIFKTINKWLFLIVTLVIILFFTVNKLIFHFSYTAIPEHFSWSQSFRKIVITRIDSVYYGFLGAFIALYYSKIWYHYKWISFSLGAFLFLSVHSYIYISQLNPNSFSLFFNVYYLSILSISILLTFPVFSNWTKGQMFSKTITKISLWSYSIYLVNYSIVLLSIKQFVFVSYLNILEKLIVLILFWAVTFILSYLLFTFFEYPILKFRDSNKFTRRFRS